MGLFDDVIGLAREINRLKEDVASTVSHVIDDITNLTDDVTAPSVVVEQDVNDLSSNVEAAVNTES